MVDRSIEKVVVNEDSIQIGLRTEVLAKLLSEEMGRNFPKSREEEVRWLDIPYKTWRQKRSSIVLTPQNAPKDILDLPPEKLKKLIQGLIWRDEHFAGMTLKDISLREKCSEAYVGTAIFSGFDILSKVIPANPSYPL